MGKTATSAIKLTHFNINVNLQVQTEEGKTVTLSDTASLNLQDEGDVSRTLAAKPFLKEVAPAIIKMLKDSYVPASEEGSQFLKDLGA